MILAVTVLSIMLLGITPTVSMEVKRSKEQEMVYRGMQMAEGIARYYNAGRLANLQLVVPPPYGYLYDLKKLADGTQIGAIQLKFVRQSALKDPMVNKDWIPIRARDPRLMGALQAYAAYNLTTVPQSYMLIAAPPARIQLVQTQGSDQDSNPTQGGGSGTFGSGAIAPAPTPGSTFGSPQGAQVKPSPKPQGDDDDDDDDDDTQNKPVDPLSHLLKDSEHGLPIVGVAPNLKGTAVHPLWGMTKYEQWVFIYIPPQPIMVALPPTGGQPLQPQNGNRTGGPGISPVSPR